MKIIFTQKCKLGIIKAYRVIITTDGASHIIIIHKHDKYCKC